MLAQIMETTCFYMRNSLFHMGKQFVSFVRIIVKQYLNEARIGQYLVRKL